MPDKKISELTVLTEATLNGSDVIPIVDVSVPETSKITVAELRLYIRAGLTKADFGLGNADNTSDLDKPISSATQAALDLKVDASDLAALNAHALDYDNTASSLTATKTGDAIDELKGLIDNIDPLPPQAGQAGKYLTTDGTDASWGNVESLPPGGTVGQVLTKNSSTDGDASWTDVESKITVSATQVITSGDLVVIDDTKSRQRIQFMGNLGPAYSSLPPGAINGQELYLQGMSDDEPIILEAYTTADLGGALSITFTKNVMKYFIWDLGQSLWILVGA